MIGAITVKLLNISKIAIMSLSFNIQIYKTVVFNLYASLDPDSYNKNKPLIERALTIPANSTYIIT